MNLFIILTTILHFNVQPQISEAHLICLLLTVATTPLNCYHGKQPTEGTEERRRSKRTTIQHMQTPLRFASTRGFFVDICTESKTKIPAVADLMTLNWFVAIRR